MKKLLAVVSLVMLLAVSAPTESAVAASSEPDCHGMTCW